MVVESGSFPLQSKWRGFRGTLVFLSGLLFAQYSACDGWLSFFNFVCQSVGQSVSPPLCHPPKLLNELPVAPSTLQEEFPLGNLPLSISKNIDRSNLIFTLRSSSVLLNFGLLLLDSSQDELHVCFAPMVLVNCQVCSSKSWSICNGGVVAYSSNSVPYLKIYVVRYKFVSPWIPKAVIPLVEKTINNGNKRDGTTNNNNSHGTPKINGSPLERLHAQEKKFYNCY